MCSKQPNLSEVNSPMERKHSSNFIDRTGITYGSLTVLGISHTKGKRVFWSCKCKCGGTRITCGSNILRAVSCGNGCPYHRTPETHGGRFHPIYDVWSSMKQRCYNPANKNWKHYGGRGIKICKRWHDFKNFMDDMLSTWKEGLKIERCNNNKGYSPENCRWVTQKVQCRNARSNHIIKTPWGKMCVGEAAEKAGLRYDTLWLRLKKRMSYNLLFLPKIP